jgi:predicted transcriptional regulator
MPKDKKTTVFNFRIRQDVKDKLQREALKRDRSASYLIHKAIEEYFNNNTLS